ncbi:hypothetical protein K2F40_16175 [Clostridium sp. CM028]|uniref:hypothetical protein n=1 Tax=unclassified Clostridium TaxID=2614128 RepID=UPI001C6EBC71|nr:MULTISPECIES: hypothetical protein [unclassified Clostridium]MBW9146553.1 hypothetical protein [Clostridium sp. CM027]MBW9150481.1 hypothetical protein [Clostridium sp. CM028]UVE42239.1 hypothetical protein KTC92_07305 [Clostridium sp. CM027]WLC62826.1 hypothetical protein KTC94_06105 [Clostridium sp. CM028]
MNKSKQEKWNLLSAVMFIVSSVMIYLGYDKLTNYYSSDVSSLTKNSYVGGDAYNYIINGTRATSFFVLATMFAILGVSFIMIGYLDKISNIKQSERIINLLEGLNENSGPKNDNLNNTLPPL